MINDVCDACEFIGPLPDGVQQVRDMHRAFHAAGRIWSQNWAPVAEAFRELGRIAREAADAAKNDYTLAPTPEEHPMPDPELIEVGDTVELARKMSTARGPVTRIDRNEHKGIGLHIDGYPPYPLWIGPRHDTWTLTEHSPLMPDEAELEDGKLYEVTTQRGDKRTAWWRPIDGIRAGHPWLDATTDPDEGHRYARAFIIRARPARAAADAAVGILAPGDYPSDRATQAAAIDELARLGVDYPEGYLDDLRNDMPHAGTTTPVGDCDVCGNPFEPGQWWTYHARLQVYVHSTCAATSLVRGEDISMHTVLIGRVPAADERNDR